MTTRTTKCRFCGNSFFLSWSAPAGGAAVPRLILQCTRSDDTSVGPLLVLGVNSAGGYEHHLVRCSHYGDHRPAMDSVWAS